MVQPEESSLNRARGRPGFRGAISVQMPPELRPYLVPGEDGIALCIRVEDKPDGGICEHGSSSAGKSNCVKCDSEIWICTDRTDKMPNICNQCINGAMNNVARKEKAFDMLIGGEMN